MTGRRGGGRRGRGRGRKAVRVEEEDPPYIPLGYPTGLRIRFPIRCVNNNSSTSSPPISTHSQQQSPSSAAKDEHNLVMFMASRYTDPHPQVDPQPSSDHVLHADDECATNVAPTYSRCFSNPASLNITEIAQKLQEDMEEDPEEEVESTLDPGFEYVNDYRVKIEHAPLVRALFERHGDIIDRSGIKSPAFLSFLLELLCGIVNRLKETKFLHVTLIELEKMIAEVEDLEAQKMNVGWLRDRIEQIIQAKLNFGKYSALKEEKKKCESNIKRLQQQLGDEKAKLDEVEKVAVEMRGEIVDLMALPSLAHGIV